MTNSKYSNFAMERRLESMAQAALPSGVIVDPVPISEGDTVTVLYNGLLSQSGAEQIYLHCGFGSHQSWHGVLDIPMEWTTRGWAKKLTVNDSSRFNFCFKDSASNWDNNNGHNWSFEIHGGYNHSH